MPVPEFLKKINDTEWEIPVSHRKDMRVPCKFIAAENIISEMDTQVFEQAVNVATLPGILGYSYCMPDGHSGYGFPIGGVAAMDLENGVISPGGIGFDINCGMRIVKTNLTYDEVKPKLRQLVDLLFKKVPAGVGSEGFVRLNRNQFIEAAVEGSKWAVEKGYGWKEDTERTEENGCMETDISKVSDRAIKRGINQIGTLGSGNHYLEIQVAKPENVVDKSIAKVYGIDRDNQVVIMFHCGSRGFGHQIATDYLQLFLDVMERKYNIKILDRELACAPFQSKEGQDYFAAMKAAMNMSFANRQVILHRIRECFSQVFGRSPEDMDMRCIYDVTHNTAKIERHTVNGEKKKVLVHRKGATRAFGPGHDEVPEIYRKVGQPVIIGGSMETGSYLLAGTEGAMQKTFGTTCHGSGRTMSRTRAKQLFRGETLLKNMEQRGIIVKSVSMPGLAEEAGAAYKDINLVIDSVHRAGISKKVVKLTPVANVKG